MGQIYLGPPLTFCPSISVLRVGFGAIDFYDERQWYEDEVVLLSTAKTQSTLTSRLQALSPFVSIIFYHLKDFSWILIS